MDVTSSTTVDALRRRIEELEQENAALTARASQAATVELSRRLSESRFRALFEQFPLSVQIFDPEGRTLAVNQAWRDLYRLPTEQLANFNPLHDPQLEPIRDQLQRGFAGEIVTIPPHLFDPSPHDGGTEAARAQRMKWLEVTVWPVVSAEGTISEVIVVHRDVTEQRRTEEAMRTSEESYRTLFELAGDAMFVHDIETGAILDANQKACELRGGTLDELKALGIGGISADVPPFDAGHARSYVRRAAAGDPQRFEWAVRHKSGEQRWVEVDLHRVSILGEDRVLASVRNITERKAAEEALQRARDELECRVEERTAELALAEQRFRAIVEASPTPLLLSGLHDGTILYANDRLEALVGVEPGSLVGQQTPDFYYDPADRPYVLRTVQQQGYARDLELRIKRADGTPRWVSLTVQQLVFNGQPALATSLLDITERKEAEDALRDRTSELEGIFRALPDLYFRMEADGTIVAYRAGRAFGLYAPPDEFLGRRVQDVLPPPVGPRIGEALAEVTRTGDLVYLEYMLPLGTERRDFEARLLPLDDGQVIAVVRDVTARKIAEEALRESEALKGGIVAAALDSIITVDGDGRIVEFNPAAERTFGYRAEDVLGQPMAGFIVPHRLRKAHAAGMDRYQRTGEAHVLGQRIEVPALRADGSEFPAELAIDAVRLEDGREVFTAYLRDVTDRKAAEATMRASEESYRGLFDALTELVYIQDLEGRFLAVNEAVVRAYGYTREEIVGRTPEFLGAPGTVDPEAFAAVFARAVAGEPQRFEWWGRRKDESIFPKEVVIKRSTYFGQDVIIAVARDITDRKEAEEALRRSEEYFRRLIENGQDLIQLIDADGLTTYVSPSVERLTGFTSDEVIGAPAERGLHWDDHADALGALQRATAQPGTTLRAEYRIRHKDGTWRVFEGYGRTFSPTSAAEGVVVNARDITERKRFDEALRASEERFRSLIENAHDITCIIDPDGAMTYLSPSIHRTLGWKPEELVGQSAFAFIHPDDVAGVVETLSEVAATPGSTGSAEYRFRHKDGTWRSLEAVGRTLSPSSPDEGIVANIRDITERREAEETLRLQKTLLEAQGEASIDGILVVSPSGEMLSFNRRFVEMWGIPPDVASSGSDDDAIRTVLGRLRNAEAFTARVRYLYDHPDEESRDEILLRDGRVFDRYSAPVRSQEGNHYGRIWFFRDITERKRAEEALRLSHEREREHAQRLEEELEVGRQIQLSFLPAELLRPTGWEVETRFQPALQVAGDFYDTFSLPIGHVGVIVADVCGKGVGAALYMALFRSLLRAHAERASVSRIGTPHAAEAVLKEAVTSTNQYIARVHKPTHLRKLGHTFASVFFGLLDPHSGTLHYVNAGHEPPVLIGPNGPMERLTPTGPALGLIADASLNVERIAIAPGETLLAYTDGVTEARNAEGGFFDEHRLLTLLDAPAPSAAALLDRIERAVHDYADGASASDDVTLMALRRGSR